jgi:hypothetical protein
MAVSDHITGSQGGMQVGPPANLATPCTLQALLNWVNNIDALGGGVGETVVTITTTSNTVTAA